MTIKLPEPDARVVVETNSRYGTTRTTTAFLTTILPVSTNLYTEAKLKQAIKDALEEAACTVVAKTQSVGRNILGEVLADEIRKPKDQL